MSESFKKWMSLRAKIGGLFKLASAAVSSVILVYEVLSGLHWLSTREFFHNKTCRAIDLIFSSDTCTTGFTASVPMVNQVMDAILKSDVFFGALVLIGIFALCGSLFIQRER
ncbi:MAG TPA: hypothetical protein VFR09_02900 [Alphaproteobacteria bacterium]|nr:hypothetical protein [Alphaproteobacteria bacterium]